MEKSELVTCGTYSVDQAAQRLGIGRTTAFQLISQGTFPIPVIRAGHRILVPKAPLEKLISGESEQSEAA